MALRSFSGRIMASSVLAVLVAGSTYGFMVHRRIKVIDASQIQRFGDIPESFRQSATMRDIVNVQNHQAMGDSRFISLDVSPELQDLPDEILLARFTKGFYGGLVIAPERIVLQTLGLRLVRFSKLQAPSLVQLWNMKELSDQSLPPLHSILLGTFQVLDVKLHPESHALKSGRTESYVDYGFGSDQVGFAGAHRFSVVRTDAAPGSDGKRTAQIHYHSTCCNPRVNKPLGPALLFSFHLAYAEFLFRDGISEVLAAGCR